MHSHHFSYLCLLSLFVACVSAVPAVPEPPTRVKVARQEATTDTSPGPTGNHRGGYDKFKALLASCSGGAGSPTDTSSPIIQTGTTEEETEYQSDVSSDVDGPTMTDTATLPTDTTVTTKKRRQLSEEQEIHLAERAFEEVNKDLEKRSPWMPGTFDENFDITKFCSLMSKWMKGGVRNEAYTGQQRYEVGVSSATGAMPTGTTEEEDTDFTTGDETSSVPGSAATEVSEKMKLKLRRRRGPFGG